MERKKTKSIWRRQKLKQGLGGQTAGGTEKEASINVPLTNDQEPRLDKESDQVIDPKVPSETTSFVEPRPSDSNTRPNSKSLHQSQSKPRRVPKESLSRTDHNPRSRPFTGERPDRRENGSMRGKGRQPSMRMKIGKMLEKIKQNHP